MNKLINKYGIIFFCIVSLITFLGIPIPCEIVLPLCGGYLKEYNYSLVYIVIINSLAVLGSLILYIIGKRIDINKIKNRKIDQALDFYNKYQNVSVLIGRFIPVVRIYISIVSGINKQNIFKFLIYSFIGIFIYNSFLIILGYVFVGKMDCLIDMIGKLKNIILSIIVAICIIIVYKILKSKK